MIVLRNKEYSSKSLQLLKSARKLGNTVSTNITNAGLKFSDRVNVALGKKDLTAGYRVPLKSNAELNRDTISLKNKVVSTPQKIKENTNYLKNELNKAALNPGNTVNKGVSFVAKNPITATGRIVGARYPILPIGSAATVGEITLKKTFKGYNNFTNNLQKRYNNGRLPGFVESSVNGAVNYAKSIS